MDCGDVKELIPLMVGGDLDPDEFDRVLDHLRSCLPCKQLHDEYMKTHQLVCMLSDDVDTSERAPRHFVVSVNRAIRLDREGSGRRPYGRWLPELARVAALVLVAVSLGIVARTLYNGQVEGTTPGTTVVGQPSKVADNGVIEVVVPTNSGMARTYAVRQGNGTYRIVTGQPSPDGPLVTGSDLDRGFESLNAVDVHRGNNIVRYQIPVSSNDDF